MLIRWLETYSACNPVETLLKPIYSNTLPFECGFDGEELVLYRNFAGQNNNNDDDNYNEDDDSIAVRCWINCTLLIASMGSVLAMLAVWTMDRSMHLMAHGEWAHIQHFRMA